MTIQYEIWYEWATGVPHINDEHGRALKFFGMNDLCGYPSEQTTIVDFDNNKVTNLLGSQLIYGRFFKYSK